MGKIRNSLIFVFLFLISICFAQSIDIEGQVFGDGDVEGIHVINKTASRFATTTALGTFNISVKLNDTIVFSSLQYKITAVLVSSEHILQKKMIVKLEEQVNVLDEVTVGKVLSGDLEFDVQNADIDKPIDFYDVGIPGFTGKPKTQSERRLYEADAGKMIAVGLGVGVNFHKLMNAISGRTKMLKERVRLEDNEVLIYKIKAELSEEFFKTHPLNENLIIEFFYFCSEDKDFESRCKEKSGIEVYQFLEEKYILFKANINTPKD